MLERQPAGTFEVLRASSSGMLSPMRSTAIGVVVGTLLAGGVHTATWPASKAPVTAPLDEPVPPPEPRTVVSWVKGACPPSADPSPDEIEVARRVDAVASLETELEAVVGVPQPFPDDLDARFTPENADATVQAVLDSVGAGAVDYVDCSEFPCLAAIRVPPGRHYMEELNSPLMQGLEDLGPAMLVGGYKAWMDGRAFVPLGEPTDERRWRYRAKVATEILGEDRRVEVEAHQALEEAP